MSEKINIKVLDEKLTVKQMLSAIYAIDASVFTDGIATNHIVVTKDDDTEGEYVVHVYDTDGDAVLAHLCGIQAIAVLHS